MHYVTAELSLRGLIALPTIRNVAGYDIIAATTDGKEHANIQVKTSHKRVNFWRMPPSPDICAGPNDYYVLVRWVAREKKFEAFMLMGKEAKAEVERIERIQGKRVTNGSRKRVLPSIHVGGKWEKQSSAWKRHWEEWHLDKRANIA